MHLPDGHGLDLLRSLRMEGHPCDAIAVTSARDREVVKRAVAIGVVLYLLKPFTSVALRARLEQYATYRVRLEATEPTVVQGGLASAQSALEVAEAVGTSRVTARRYVEHRADTGLADRQSRYGRSGRPEVEYRWRR